LLANGIDANAIIQRRLGDGAEPNTRKPDSQKPGFLWHRPTIVFGVPALGYAIREDKSDDLWIVQMLLNSRADPNGIVTESFDIGEGLGKETALLKAIARNKLATVIFY
jgi:hypothetical protein